MPFESPVSQDNLSAAYVRGREFIAIRNTVAETTKIYELSISLTVLTIIDRTDEISAGMSSPFSIDDVESITGSYNYLILLTKAVCFWSSTTTPTDFVVSLVSGAGFEFPGNLKGNIRFGKEHSAGFFINTNKNALFAAYTGNFRYPWKFREVRDSGGYDLQTQVSGGTNTSFQGGVTVTGQVQSLQPEEANNLSPEISTFLERSTIYDRFDLSTSTFSLIQGLMRGPSTQFQIYFFLDRYLLIPYGRITTVTNKYEYALIFDTQLKRLGKLAFPSNFYYSDEAKIFFVANNTGVIKSLNFDITALNGAVPLVDGIALFGKFQYVRGNFIQIEELELESTVSTSIISVANRSVTVKLIPTFDGKNFVGAITLVPDTIKSVGNLISFPAHTTAQNFCVLARGALDISSLSMRFNVHGSF